MSNRQKASHRAKATRTTNHEDRVIGPGRWRRRNFSGKERAAGKFRFRRLGKYNHITKEWEHKDDWEWKATQVPGPKRYKHNRMRNKMARKSRKRNR